MCLAYSVFLVVMALTLDSVGEAVMLGVAAWAMSLTLRAWGRPFTKHELREWFAMVICACAAWFL